MMSKQSRWWLFGALAVCLALPAWAAGKSAPRREHARIPVTVRVDFGPAAARKPALEQQLMVDEGSTPKDAVSLLVPIQSGEVCCDTREVLAIDGVRPDPSKNWWWNCRVNGSSKISAHRTVLNAGDTVEWFYHEVPQ